MQQLRKIRRLRPEQWRSYTILAILYVLVASLALWFFLPTGRAVAGQTVGVVVIAHPDAIQWARALNAFAAVMVAMQAKRAGGVADMLTALGFALVLIWNGSGQAQQGVPLTLGFLVFTIFNLLVCWRWADGLNDRAETIRESRRQAAGVQ